MHKNAIKNQGGVKILKKLPLNVGFFDKKLWDFQQCGGGQNFGIFSTEGGFSEESLWPHWSVQLSKVQNGIHISTLLWIL